MVRKIRSVSRAIREASRPTAKLAMKRNKKILKLANKVKRVTRK